MLCPVCNETPLPSPAATVCGVRCRKTLSRRRAAERDDRIRALTRELGAALAGKDYDAAAKHHRELARHVRDLPTSR